MLFLIHSSVFDCLHAVMTSTGNSATRLVPRTKCFVCEVPQAPWALLHDYAEPVCRACCNYEGMYGISEVIDNVRELKRSFDVHSNRLHSNSDSVNSPTAPKRPLDSHSPTTSKKPLVTDSTTGYIIPQQISGGNVIVTTAGLQPAFCYPVTVTQATSIAGPSPALTQKTPSILPFSSVVPMPGHQLLKEYFAEETYKILNVRVPFNIRFRKNHSLLGRAIYFLIAKNTSNNLYLQFSTEYPIGSGKVFYSASGVVTQMYMDCGEVSKVCTNGYRVLEYQKKDDDWINLQELLTEDVRFFRTPPEKELLPEPYIDPQHSYIPTQRANYTTLEIIQRGLSSELNNIPISSFAAIGSPHQTEISSST